MVLAPLVEQKQKYKNLSVQRAKEMYNEKTLLVHTYTSKHTHTHTHAYNYYTQSLRGR